jgi:hypothetical protein
LRTIKNSNPKGFFLFPVGDPRAGRHAMAIE